MRTRLAPAVATAVLVTALLVGAGWLVGTGRSAGDPATVLRPAAAGSTAGSTSAPAELPRPTWTPPSVTGQVLDCPAGTTGRGAGAVDARPGQQAGQHQDTAPESCAPPEGSAVTWVYSLGGEANLSNLPPRLPPDRWSSADVDAFHMGTEITYIVYPNSTALHEPVLDPFTVVEQITLPSGIAARLTTNASPDGVGTTRLEWVQDGHSLTLFSYRLATPSGTSGPTQADLVAMAGSVR